MHAKNEVFVFVFKKSSLGEFRKHGKFALSLSHGILSQLCNQQQHLQSISKRNHTKKIIFGDDRIFYIKQSP